MAHTKESVNVGPYFGEHFQGDECPVEDISHFGEIGYELKALPAQVQELLDLRRRLAVFQARRLINGFSALQAQGERLVVVDPEKLALGAVIKMEQEAVKLDRQFNDRNLKTFLTDEHDLRHPDDEKTELHRYYHTGVVMRLGQRQILVSSYPVYYGGPSNETKDVVWKEPVKVGQWQHDRAVLEHEVTAMFNGVHRWDWFSRINEARAF